MKKTIAIVVLAISVLVVVSCKTTGGQVTDETFRKIYDKHWNDLILDGAGTYTVQSGDTLAHIARSEYEDGYYYPLIMLASRDVVLDPDKIAPGMELIIPDLEANLAGEKSRASVKGVIQDCAKIEDDRGRADTAKGLRDHASKL